MNSARQTSRAFTLVELLVVVAVIAVLVAMLLPALRKARQAALGVQCLSNLRQAGLGFQMYAHENNQYIPIYRGKSGNHRMWAWFLCYGVNSHDQPTGKVFVKRNVSICPANEFYERDRMSDDPATASAGPVNVSYAAYRVMNNSQSVFKNSSLQSSVTIGFAWAMVVQRVNRLPVSASTAVLLGDSISNHGSSLGGGWHMIGTFTDNSPTDNPEYNGRLYLQHGERCNVLFYDGHAASLTHKELRYETAQNIKQVMDGKRKLVTIP